MNHPDQHNGPGNRPGWDDMHELVQEFCDSRGARIGVDREAGVIRGVKILGLESTNGRTYLADALAAASRLYEGAKVNVNHPKGSPLAPRDYQDRIGVMRNVGLRAGAGLFGDLHYNPKHALAEQLAWDAEHAPESVGFSHNVQARTSTKGGRTVVEAITHVVGVDLVADPATTRGLFESRPAAHSRSPLLRNSSPGANPMEITLEALKTQPDVLQALRSEILAEHAASEEARLQADELARLRAEVDAFQAREALVARRASLEGWIAEAGVPKEAVSDVFLEQLLAADEVQARRLVEDRAALVKWFRSRRAEGAAAGPKSRDQQSVESPGIPGDGKSFAALVR